MEKESWFYRFLRWARLINAHEVDKKEMCESAKSVCNRKCETCIWNDEV